MAWLEDDPSTNLVWLSNDTRMGRRGFLALANATEGLTTGADVVMQAPPTPTATFLRILLDQGESAAMDYAGTLDWSNPPVANAAAIQATGAPDGGVGETLYAWAPATADAGAEWLTLNWDVPVKAHTVHVQFTQVPGVLTALDTGSGEQAITDFSFRQGESAQGAPIEMYSFENPAELDTITLHLDTTQVAGWPQIDAVGLIDARGKIHWADSANASTSYFDAAPIALHDLPTRSILAKLARRLEENGPLLQQKKPRRSGAISSQRVSP